MGNIPLTFLPPQNWQDFEKMLKGLVDVIWKQEGWQIYGRNGQSQSGIDLFGYDELSRFTAIQCKKKNQTNSEGQLLTISLLTKKTIEEEITLAEEIKDPELERLIFATTSPRDVGVQNIIKSINHKRKKAEKFLIDIWFWDDIQVYIENHIELMYWYYSDVLEKVHIYDKNTHVLTMLKRAFSRPAYIRLIGREESGADFIQAIKDTMEAISTGKLYNRRGHLIATSFDYEKITNENWRTNISKIYNKLNEIRDIYQQGIKDGLINEYPSCLEIIDFGISESFNKIRMECIQSMNKILKEAKLNSIESELIRH